MLPFQKKKSSKKTKEASLSGGRAKEKNSVTNGHIDKDETASDEDSVALEFLMMEESTVKGGGWEDEQELDYSHINAMSNNTTTTEASQLPMLELLPGKSRRESTPVQMAANESVANTGPREDTTAANAFSYSRTSLYQVRQFGELISLSNEWLEPSQDPNTLLKLINRAQDEGVLPWTSQSECDRLLVLNKYGIKVTDTFKQRVYKRHPLQDISSIMHYVTPSRESLLIVKMIDTTTTSNVFVYECQKIEQAVEICEVMSQIFELVLNQLKLEDNLGRLK
jgi:hypothetical protein